MWRVLTWKLENMERLKVIYEDSPEEEIRMFKQKTTHVENVVIISDEHHEI